MRRWPPCSHPLARRDRASRAWPPARSPGRRRPSTPCLILPPLLLLAAHATLLLDTSAQQSPPPSESGWSSPRVTTSIEGIDFTYPENEVDVVRIVAPIFAKFRQVRARFSVNEAEAIVALLQEPGLHERLGQRVALVYGRDDPGENFDAAWNDAVKQVEQFGAAWQSWNEGVARVHLYNPGEAAGFLNEAHDTYRFSQIAYSKDGQFSITPGFVRYWHAAAPLDIDPDQITPFVFDYPLIYKPGDPLIEIARKPAAFLPNFNKGLQGFLLKFGKALPHWLVWHLTDAQLPHLAFTPESIESSPVPKAVAVSLAYQSTVASVGREQATRLFANALFSLGLERRPPDPASFLAALESLDPLDPPPLDAPFGPALDRVSRQLIALALFNLSAEAGGAFKLLQEAEIEVPDGGFSPDQFLQSIDSAVEKPRSFDKSVAAIKANLLASARQKLAELPPGKAPEDTLDPVDPTRTATRVGDITVTHPPGIEEAVRIVGPELERGLSAARAEVERILAAQGRVELDYTDEDAAALGAYGLSADIALARGFKNTVASFVNPSEILLKIFGGDTVQIWFRQDLVEVLQAGHTIPGFQLDPDSRSGTYTYNLGAKGTRADELTAAEAARQINDADPPVYPAILDDKFRQAPPDQVAAEIGSQFTQWFGSKSKAFDPESIVPKRVQLIDEKQAFFIIVHELAEYALIQSVIASNDRRWFCDGMANYIAILECDRRYGQGRGIQTFSALYPDSQAEPVAAEVDLLAWPALENEKKGPKVRHGAAHYHFATRAILAAAAAARGDAPSPAPFIQAWLEQIRRTPWNRTNSRTVFTAYQQLTGKDLERIVRSVTAR